MKLYIGWIFLFFLVWEGNAQKINRHYSFYPQESGNVYYIHPQKGFTGTNKEAVKELEYDITYLSGRDSVSWLFSYYTNQVFSADSLQFTDHAGNIVYQTPVRMMYIQPKGKYWQQRAEIKVPYTLLTDLYRQSQPYSILLKGESSLQYNMKTGTWKKQSGIVNKITEVIKYNK